IVGGNHSSDADRFIEPAHILIGARQAVHGVGKRGIKFNGFLVFFNRQFMLVVTEKVQRPVIMIFCRESGVFGHPRNSSTLPSGYTRRHHAPCAPFFVERNPWTSSHALAQSLSSLAHG